MTKKKPAPDLGDGLLNLEDAAKLLGVAAVTLRVWSVEGKISYVRLGKRKLFYRQELARFAKRNTVKAGKP